MNKINEVDTIDMVDNAIFIVYKIATYVGGIITFYWLPIRIKAICLLVSFICSVYRTIRVCKDSSYSKKSEESYFFATIKFFLAIAPFVSITLYIFFR